MAISRKPKYIGRDVDSTIFETVQSAENEKKPNVVYIVLDDLGFAQLHCYGSTINTPNIDRLANEGLRYNNFHTTAVCSATRASLLTGANHHSVGVCAVVEQTTGCPNGTGHIDPAYATIAEILHENNYGTYCVGKWHLTNTMNTSEAGPFEDYPQGKGFDHYYGFLDGQMDQFHPTLVRDNTFVTAPYGTKDGYHLSKDLTDEAIRYVFTHTNNEPEKPFFVYLAYGAMHAPHQAPTSYIEKYKGKFHEGWDSLRQQWFENQKALGIIPEETILTERNELVKAWDDLDDDTKKVFERYMEAFAGFLDYTDEQIGRFINFLEEIEELDNTIVVFVSDNGASAEGGQNGHFNTLKSFDIVDDNDEVSVALERLDLIGTEKSYNHYPLGWANLGNVPFPWYKTWTYSGGTKDPFIIRYPKAITDFGGIRNQYEHVIDVTPTILSMLGIEKPHILRGVPQKPFSGESFEKTFADPNASGRYLQYYELLGNRAIYKDGWKAVVNHSLNDSFEEDEWELYHVDEDYSESRNVAEQYPEKLRELQDEWLIEAGKHGVLPMLDMYVHKKNGIIAMSKALFELPGTSKTYKRIFEPFIIDKKTANRLRMGSFALRLKLKRENSAQDGVLLSVGGRFGGYSWYIKENHFKVAFNELGERVHTFISKNEVPVGEFEAKLIVEDVGNGYVELRILTDQTLMEQEHFYVGVRGSFMGGETIGQNLYDSVTDDYEVPYRYKGELISGEFTIAPVKLRVKEELDKFFLLD